MDKVTFENFYMCTFDFTIWCNFLQVDDTPTFEENDSKNVSDFHDHILGILHNLLRTDVVINADDSIKNEIDEIQLVVLMHRDKFSGKVLQQKLVEEAAIGAGDIQNRLTDLLRDIDALSENRNNQQ